MGEAQASIAAIPRAKQFITGRIVGMIALLVTLCWGIWRIANGSEPETSKPELDLLFLGDDEGLCGRPGHPELTVFLSQGGLGHVQVPSVLFGQC